jgi:hypothetical protein
VLATHDDGRLRDPGQALLDPVCERRAKSRQQRPGAEDGVVARDEPDHRQRFPPGIS